MSLWGISTNAETATNNYAIPKYLGKYSSTTGLFEATDRNRSPYNCFADNRGWIQRHYKTAHHAGISTRYWDSILVPVAGLNTAGAGTSTTGLGQATPIAVFFEDPNFASPISISAGGTTGISTNTVGYVHVVWNEAVYCSAGATVLITPSTGPNIVAYAASAGVPVQVNVPEVGQTVVTFNGQITNRVAFAFTAPSALSGIGTVLRISTENGVVGTITDFSGGGAVNKVIDGLVKNVAGAGTTSGVGIGTTTLTIKA
jgi:hypothetical protein